MKRRSTLFSVCVRVFTPCGFHCVSLCVSAPPEPWGSLGSVQPVCPPVWFCPGQSAVGPGPPSASPRGLRASPLSGETEELMFPFREIKDKRAKLQLPLLLGLLWSDGGHQIISSLSDTTALLVWKKKKGTIWIFTILFWSFNELKELNSLPRWWKRLVHVNAGGEKIRRELLLCVAEPLLVNRQ